MKRADLRHPAAELRRRGQPKERVRIDELERALAQRHWQLEDHALVHEGQ